MTYSILGKDVEGKPVSISQSLRRYGLYMIGSTGTGKSTLIESLILQDIRQGYGVCVLDPHGDLINGVLAKMDRRLEDVILLDLGDRDCVAGFNLFFCEQPEDPFARQNVVSAVMHVLDKVYQISRGTPQMHQYFTNITNTLLYNPSASVLDIPRLLTDVSFRKQLISRVPNEHVRWFWREFEKKSRLRRDDEIAAVVNKLDEFLSGILTPWFGHTKNTIPMRQIMDERKILLVKLKVRWSSITDLVGSIIIAQILDAAYSREELPPTKRRQFNVYADEFQRFASEDFATLFTESRKFGIGLTIAHQTGVQIEERIKETCRQARNIVVFEVSDKNAKELAGIFNTSKRAGPPRYEPIRTPVREPIHFLLTHGSHPGKATRQFTQRYEKLLVDGAKHEEAAELEYHRAVARYEYGLADQQDPAFLATPPPNLCRETLSHLNRLLHEAMCDGTAGKNPDEMTALLDNFIRAVVPEAQEFLDAWDQYYSLEDRSQDLFDLAPRKEALHKKLAGLPDRQKTLLSPRQEFEAAQEQLVNFMKDYLRDEARYIRSHFGIIRRGALYYFISRGRYWANTPFQDSSSYEDPSYRILYDPHDKPEDPEKTASDLLPPSSSFERSNSVPFASWEAAACFFWRQLQKNHVWFRAERYINDPQWWQYQRAMVRCERKDDRYTAFSRPTVEELDVWLLQPGVEQHWYTAAMLEAEVAKRLQDRAQKLHDPGIDYLEWITGQVRWSKSLIGARLLNLDQGLRTFTDAKNRLERATYALTEQIKQETEKIHHELNLIEIIEQQRNSYEALVVELETLIRHMMAELAEAPLLDASGLMREITTELSSSEAEARIANELSQQQTYQAHVRTKQGKRIITSIITTLPPAREISQRDLLALIEEIKRRNRKAGYLQLRSDVEREIASRQQHPPEEPPPPPTRPHPPSSPPPPSTPMQRRKKVV